MRRVIAITILTTQMLAGVCALDADARSVGNSCCKAGAVQCMGQSCDCCRLDSANLPSLAASFPAQTARPMAAVLLPVSARAFAFSKVKLASSLNDSPAISPSPPRLYVLNASFLI